MKIALIGNQNSGKSTLFNTLTGANQKIGNWPGVTIEKKSGIIKNTDFELIDLPGIYSLNPYTKEESVTSNFVYENEYDVLINIIDCNSIGRGLYLTTQLLELNKIVIVVLNMHEIAEKNGIVVDETSLSKELNNIMVLKVSAVTGEGCEKLIKHLNFLDKKIKVHKEIKADNKETNQSGLKKFFEISNSLESNRKEKIKNNLGFSKNLKSNKEKIKDILGFSNSLESNRKENTKNIFELNNGLEPNYETKIEAKYRKIDSILNSSVIYKKLKKQNLTDKIDKIILNKFLAILIFAIIMFFVYYFSIEIVGNSTIELINNSIDILKYKLETILIDNKTSPILVSLLIDGIISGIATVISFLPQLFFLFIAISILEKIGYMSRISLIFDKLFRRIGISGNSVISFILGTGCSVPGIMATKTIKNEREKDVTAMLTPFIPCSAKLPIISLFSSYFFRENSGLVALSFYILAIFIIVISSLLFKKIKYDSKENFYISELPEYRIPKLNHILRDSFEKVMDFIKRTGSVILISSIVVWVLLSYSVSFERINNKESFKFEYGISIEDSILADIGRCFSWLFIPMVGENSWEIAVSSIQGLIAKEQVISSMAIIAELDGENPTGSMFTGGSPFDFFTPSSAYTYVCFNLFSAPCLSAISAMRKALGGTKKMIKAVVYQILVAYIASCAIYALGNLCG